MAKLKLPLENWKLNNFQHALIKGIDHSIIKQGNQARWKVETIAVAAGRAVGKTKGAVWLSLINALQLYQYKQANINDYRQTSPLVQVAICAPTVDQYKAYEAGLQLALREISEATGIPENALYGKRVHDGKYWLFEEYQIDIKLVSLYNGDTIRSKNIDLLVVDECAFIERDQQFFEAVEPCLTRAGVIPRMILLSSPKGKANQFFKYWKLAGGKEQKKGSKNKALVMPHPEGDSVAFQFTSYDNEINAHNFHKFDKMAEQNAAQYNSEVLAEFSDGLDAFAMLGDWEKYTTNQFDYNPDMPCAIGFDPAYGGEDYSVITVVEMDKKRLIDGMRYKTSDTTIHFRNLELFTKKYPNYTHINYDANGSASTWYSILTGDYGLRVKPHTWGGTLQQKIVTFQTLKTQLDLGNIKLNHPLETDFGKCPHSAELAHLHKLLFEEWETFVIKKNKSGQVKIEHQSDEEHDDIICSYAMAAYSFFDRKFKMPRVEDKNNAETPAQRVRSRFFGGMA